MKLTETIYPKGIETHTNEIICIDHASGKLLKSYVQNFMKWDMPL